MALTRTPDPTGRVDLLISRILETAVSQSGDPILKALYQQNKPDVDRTVGKVFRKYNCAPVLRKLGLAPPKQPKPGVRKASSKGKGVAA